MAKTIAEIKEMCERNQRECEFRVLLKKIGDFYKYTPEDNKWVYESYKINPDGVVKALKDQAEGIDNFKALGANSCDDVSGVLDKCQYLATR
jgi:hypothetical protein